MRGRADTWFASKGPGASLTERPPRRSQDPLTLILSRRKREQAPLSWSAHGQNVGSGGSGTPTHFWLISFSSPFSFMM